MSPLQFLALTMVTFLAIGVVLAGVIAIATTMLSSRISREEEAARK